MAITVIDTLVEDQNIFFKRKSLYDIDGAKLTVVETQSKESAQSRLDVWKLSELNNGNALWRYKRDGVKGLSYFLVLVQGNFNKDLSFGQELIMVGLDNRDQCEPKDIARVRTMVCETPAVPVNGTELLKAVIEFLRKKKEALNGRQKEIDEEKEKKELEERLLAARQREKEEKEKQAEQERTKILKKAETFKKAEELMSTRERITFWNQDTLEAFRGIAVYDDKECVALGQLVRQKLSRGIFVVCVASDGNPRDAFVLKEKKNNIVRQPFNFRVAFNLESSPEVVHRETKQDAEIKIQKIYLNMGLWQDRDLCREMPFVQIDKESDLNLFIKQYCVTPGVKVAINCEKTIEDVAQDCLESLKKKGKSPSGFADKKFFPVYEILAQGYSLYGLFPKAPKSLRNKSAR